MKEKKERIWNYTEDERDMLGYSSQFNWMDEGDEEDEYIKTLELFTGESLEIVTNKHSYIITGGGELLEFIEGGDFYEYAGAEVLGYSYGSIHEDFIEEVEAVLFGVSTFTLHTSDGDIQVGVDLTDSDDYCGITLRITELTGDYND